MRGAKRWFQAVLPLAVLALVVLLVARGGVVDFLRRGVPPVEDLTFTRVALAPGEIALDLINGGPAPVTVAQVMVDDAYWSFTITPANTIGSLGTARIVLPFPWVQDEPHEVVVLTATGLTFAHTIEVATATPTIGARYLGVFTAIGLYVGVIPVAIGLLWFPLLRTLSRRWMQFALALTVGLLVFLGADSMLEAFELAGSVAGGLKGEMLVVMAFVGSYLGLQSLARTGRSAPGPTPGFPVALAIAIGIGLHNMGEGLAIGAAYSLGDAVLGASLMIGFMLHNTTEGLAIVAPLASESPPVRRLLGLGLVAGIPTVFGALIGGLAYSPALATVFLGLGAGAIVQVVEALLRTMAAGSAERAWSPLNAGGVLLGLGIMYGTGLLVAI